MKSLLNKNVVSIGYFAKEIGSIGKQFTQIHIVKNGKAMCGYKPVKSMKFQWCTDGINYKFIRVECEKCKKKFEK
jgi:hypothetical protein